METRRNVEDEEDNSEDEKEIDEDVKEENYMMHEEKDEKEKNSVAEVYTSDKDLKSEAAPTAKEVVKGIKRKVGVEENYE